MSFKTTFKVTYTDNSVFEDTMFYYKNPMTNAKHRDDVSEFIREFDSTPDVITSIEIISTQKV